MKELSIRETRKALAEIDELLAKEGEIVVTNRGRPVARLLPHGRQARRSRLPSLESLRASMCRSKIGSEELLREERDER